MADAQDKAEGFDDDELDGGPVDGDEPIGADPLPPEEAAIHVIDEAMGGFDSEVDDPELAAAHEIDPEPER